MAGSTTNNSFLETVGLISVCIGGAWILRRATTAPPVTWPYLVSGVGIVCWFVWTANHEAAKTKRPGMFAEWKQHLVNSARQHALADAQRSLSKLSAAAADIQTAVKALEAMAESLQNQ